MPDQVDFLRRASDLNFQDQLKLQARRRFEEESRLYDAALDGHVRALEAIAANANQGVLLTESVMPDGSELRIQYVNPAFTRITGFTAEELIGHALDSMFRGKPNQPLTDMVRASVRTASSGRLEFISERRDGTAFWADSKFIPVTDSLDRPVKWLFFVTDVSDTKQNRSLTESVQALETENRRLLIELEERRAVAARLEFVSLRDSVTGFKSRSYFLERLDEALHSQTPELSYKGCVLSLSLDDFREQTRSMDRLAVERLIIEVADRLRAIYPHNQTLSRFEDGEFVALLQGSSENAHQLLVDKLSRTMQKPFNGPAGPIALRSSLGACMLTEAHTKASDVVRNAGIAMYRARRRGGEHCVWFDDAQDDAFRSLLRDRDALQRAMQQNEIELFYQPQFDVMYTPPKLSSVEATLRWNHPTRGTLGARELTRFSQSLGLEKALALYLMREASRQMVEWQTSPLRPSFLLRIRLEESQLTSPDFFRDFIDVMSDAGLDAQSLQFEVPETIRKNREGTVLLGKLHELGVNLTIAGVDDRLLEDADISPKTFSNLSLDRGLLHALRQSATRMEVARFLIELARAHNITPVATDVAEKDTSDVLRQLGCSAMQGPLYFTASTADAIADFLDGGAAPAGGTTPNKGAS